MSCKHWEKPEFSSSRVLGPSFAMRKERTVGPDGEPISRLGWTADRAHLHSVDARQELAWF
jgi:hypothetical protein